MTQPIERRTSAVVDSDTMILAYALYKLGEPVVLTDAELDQIEARETPALRVHFDRHPDGVTLSVLPSTEAGT
jgi:hypothetical protein